MKRLISLATVLFMLVCLISIQFAEASSAEYTQLSNGSKGQAVEQLQRRLKELGYYTSTVDADYGSRTKGAVYSFQKRHGLSANGIATPETQVLIYSSDAKKVPERQAVYISDVTKRNDSFEYTVHNNLGEAIDEISVKVITYGPNCNIVTNETITDKDNLMTNTWYSSQRIGSMSTARYSFESDQFHYGAIVSVVAVGVVSYHTASGKNVWYDTNEIVFYRSDGSVLYPEDEVNIVEYMDDDEITPFNDYLSNYPDEISEFLLGMKGCIEITPWLAECYGMPIGKYMTEIVDDTPIQRAGIRVGDVITAFDGRQYTCDTKADTIIQLDAKEKLLYGEGVEVTYYRNNISNNAMLFMKGEIEEELVTNKSIADELVKLAGLLDGGYITQEEFEQFKAKLIND